MNISQNLFFRIVLGLFFTSIASYGLVNAGSNTGGVSLSNEKIKEIKGVNYQGKIMLMWSSPSTQIESVTTDYKIEYRVVGKTKYSVYNDGVSKNKYVLVKNLKNGTEYEFRVTIRGKKGISKPSDSLIMPYSNNSSTRATIYKSSEQKNSGGTTSPAPSGGTTSPAPSGGTTSPAPSSGNVSNSALAIIKPGIALDLGVYTPASLLGCSAYPQSITDFSTFTYDATRNKIFMFGGGHSATPRTDVDTFNLAAATLSWKSDYISTQFSDMQASNYDVDRGGWISTGHPTSRHTYDLFPYAKNIGELISFGASGVGAIGSSCQNPSMVGITQKEGYVWHYNPTSKKWRSTVAMSFGSSELANAAEYDPISGKVIIITRYGLYIYDPITTTLSRPMSFARGEFSYGNNLVYYPPNQKMYLMQSDGQAFEVILNRNDFSKSTIVKMNVTGTLRPFTNPGGTSSGDGETGWAYDSVNKIIGGGIYNNTFYAFDPVSSTMKAVTMTSSSGNPIGNLMKMHTIDFDSVDGVFIFITSYRKPGSYDPATYRTWAYKYNGGISTSPPPTNDTTAPSSPGNLVATGITQTSLMLTWGASTDNVGTVGYKISRNNTVIKTISGTSLTDSGLSPGAQYTYGVVAFDAANNLSQPSNTTITTLTSSSSPVTPSPSLIFSQSAQSISNGSSVTLTWSSSGASSCLASGGWSGSKATSGTAILSPTTTTTYTLACSNAAGNVSQSLVVSVISGGQSGSGITNGLVGYWSFDHITGNGAIDYSGNNFLGVLTNSPTLVTGKIGKALYFDGVSNAYVATPVNTNLSRGTLSFWVNPTASISTGRIYPIFRAGSTGNFIELYFDSYAGNGNPWVFRIRGNYGNVVSASVPISSNAELQRWQHIVVTWDISSGVQIYIDGVQKANALGTTGIITNTYQMIGSDVNTFLGTIDEARVYNRILSNADITSLYNSTTLSVPPLGPDVLPPTVPSYVYGNPSSQTTIELTWQASADNVGVAGYKVYRNGNLIGNTTKTAFTDYGLVSNTTYTYTISAFDAAGNSSVTSSPSTAPTSPPPIPLVAGNNGTIPAPGAQEVLSEDALHLMESSKLGSTWYMISYDIAPWKHPGGDWKDKNFIPQGTTPWATSIPIQNIDTEQKITFDVTDLLRNQLTPGSSRIPNRGWILKYGSGSAEILLHTKDALDATKRPMLHIETSNGVVDMEVTEDAGMSYGSYVPAGGNTTCPLGGSSYLGVWFNLKSIIGTINKATLTVTTTDTQYGGASRVLNLFPIDLSETFVPIPIQTGIASKYKNDIGLETDPSVIFMERYPDLNMEKRGWVVDTGLQRSIVGDVDSMEPKYVPLAPGIKSYKMTVPKGTYGGDFGRWVFWTALNYEPEEIYIRTYARLGDRFDSMAGKFPFGFDGTYARYSDFLRSPATGRMLSRPDAPPYAGNGGSTSNGRNGWSARGGYYAQDCDAGGACLDWNDPKVNSIFKAGYRQLDYYTYWADQPGAKGSRFTWDNGLLGLIPKNKWFSLEHYFKANTINPDGSGNQDGILRVWIDGRLAYEDTHFRTRNWPGNPEGAKNIKLYSLWLNFYNGGLAPANSDLTAYLANTVISKSYIGPSGM